MTVATKIFVPLLEWLSTLLCTILNIFIIQQQRRVTCHVTNTAIFLNKQTEAKKQANTKQTNKLNL